MQNTVLRLRDLTSGQTARDYRKKLAGFTKRPNSVLAMKFRLEIPESRARMPGFPEYRASYDYLEGVGKGSLTYFLFTVVLSGFRVFTDAASAETFAKRGALATEDFAASVCDAFGGQMPDFTPAAILKRLATAPRARGGKDNSFSEQVIVSEYTKSLAKKKGKEVPDARIQEIFKAIAVELLPFTSWNELTKSIPKACEAVDRALTRFGSFPSLAAMVRASVTSLPAFSTIVYDSDAPVLDVPVEIQPYAVVASVLRNFKGESSEQVRFTQLNLTTSTHGGLSWLYGNGLKYWRETDTKDIAKAYGVPEERIGCVERIREAALAIPEQTFFTSEGKPLSLSVFRTALGGRLDSWVANYINRLQELKDILTKLPTEIRIPSAFVSEGEDFLDTTDCTRSEIETLCRVFGQSRSSALDSIQTLLGEKLIAEDIAEKVRGVVECSALINRLSAIRFQLVNAMEQAAKDEMSPWKSLLKDAEKEFSTWKALEKSLPKLNKMSGGVPSVESELAGAVEGVGKILSARAEHLERLRAWEASSGIRPDVVGHMEEIEGRRLELRKSVKANAGELAIRSLLNRVGRLVRGRRDASAAAVMKWYDDNGIFASQKSRNQYFCNVLGSIYVSPFSNSRHQGYFLGEKVIERRRELWNSLCGLIRSLKPAPFTEEAETAYRLSDFVETQTISAIPGMIPEKIAALNLDEHWTEAISESIRLQLRQPEVTGATLAKAFNVYTSLMSGLNTVLRRERFYLRTKFIWVENNALVYHPKDVLWSVPEDRYAKAPVWTDIFESDLLVRNDAGLVKVRETFERIAGKLKTEKPELLGHLLRQLPHDWCYPLPFADTVPGESSICLKVSKKGAKGTVLIKKTYSRANLARLVGPSSYKSRLDEMLVKPVSTIGDMTLLVDQPVEQRLSDGAVNLTYGVPQLSLAVPFSQEVDRYGDEIPLPFSRIVAIDQGEAGIAYAVFNLQDAGNEKAEPIASGTVRIPAIRNLIKGVKKYRKGGQAVQKFNQRFDSSMFTMRENVAGDVCGAIVGLMQRFHAFPVLEYQVKNLASGSKQLSLVYKMVNARFLYSQDVQMQNTERKSWWFGGDVWKPAGLMIEVDPEKIANKKDLQVIDGKSYRQLNIFPGASVNAAFTSRICSHCGRNVFDLLKSAEQKKVRQLSVNAGGEVQLEGKTLRLFARPTKEQSHQAARRNERAEWTQPMKAGTYPFADVARAIKENMRRSPISKQSRDTSQSRYFCVFKDCEWNGRAHHADVNAAINIGRRLLKALIYRDPLKVTV